MKTIQQDWEGFAKMVIPRSLQTDVQYVEMKKAFFAGALTLLTSIYGISSQNVSEDVSSKWLADWKAELDSYYRTLIKDYSETN